jgi:hypothetical protein
MKLVEYGLYQLFYNREVLIMCTKTACELPNSLNRIKLWTVRRQEQQLQSMPTFSKPKNQQFCVMPASIVYNNNHLAALTVSSEKTFQEPLKRICIERLSTFGDKGAISNANRPNIPICFLVGACSVIGSLTSEGIHMTHREPCCWK